MRHDPVGNAQGAAEEGAFGVVHLDQPAREQPCGRMEPGAPGGGVRGHPAQVERERHGRPATGHVVIEVAVQRLEGAVQVGRQRDQQDLGVEGAQAQPVGEPVEAVVLGRPGLVRLRRVLGFRLFCRAWFAGPLPLVRAGRNQAFRFRPPEQQVLYRLLRQIHPAHRVGGRRVLGAAAIDEERHPRAQFREPFEQGGGVVHFRCS